MANEKLVTLSQLTTVKTYVDAKDALALKSADYSDNTVKLYTTTDKSGDPAVTINLPEEQFLDQAKTAFVGEFAWSEETYPGSSDPSLDGKPVLVLAVKGDDSVNYSFVSLEKLIDIYTGEATNSITVTVSADNKITAELKISAEEGNALEVKSDGLYVATATIPYATDDEVAELFKID